jgi:hypothetical protein
MQERDIKLGDGRIVRNEEPLNLEMPFEKLEGFLTPLNHFTFAHIFQFHRSTEMHGGFMSREMLRSHSPSITKSCSNSNP